MKNLNVRVHVPYVKKNALEKQHSAEALLQTFHEIKALFIHYSVSYLEMDNRLKLRNLNLLFGLVQHSAEHSCDNEEQAVLSKDLRCDS